MQTPEADTIAIRLGLTTQQVSKALAAFADGATIPFLARYRKEMTGGLDEVQLAAIRDEATGLQKLHARRAAIVDRLREDGALTNRLMHLLHQAETVAELNEIYAPYQRKRKTRAEAAIERGLEPLARRIYDQQTLDLRAGRFINTDLGVASEEEAIAGALDIVAAWIAENDEIRRRLRLLFTNAATVLSTVKKGKEGEGDTYRDYFDYREPAKMIPSHRLLAVLRGEAAGVLQVRIRPDDTAALPIIEAVAVRSRGPVAKLVRTAVADAWKRLLAPSLETALRARLRTAAETAAIAVFTQNIRQLLLAPPAGDRPVLAIDPGYRTGCKAVALDRHGRILESTVLHLLGGQSAQNQAAADLNRICLTHEIDLIAIGNGSGGRDCEAFVRATLPAATVVRIDESGASIYSASPVARDEFPDLDITVRGAISIGRRLQDPLAELIKIDPRSIGVGQYQHDVDQSDLQRALDDTVISCVNLVGVDLNRAGPHILRYVAGIGPATADAIVSHREQNGPFRSRRQLLLVPRLGPRTFEQAAGFLRVSNGDNPLDRTGVHPESYAAIEKISAAAGIPLHDFSALARACKSPADSSPTAAPSASTIAELEAGSRDPRGQWQQARFSDAIRTIGDLHIGMRLNGTVSNLTQFGAFVDLGIGQDGLIHISEMADRFIRDPAEVVSLQQPVFVTVIGIDPDRKRIALSLKR